ncbi:hypothetical protein TEA_004588 [Camellia sinensis var. sinensis]|uniref:SET domain-containing protein n=1 Tax=Camellia sinensis var. sinensis TaxID=542762 RepID=A0A4S4DHH4_CAMSN|nr:hypothetical protein TEA_004588 [Camellia sinensis var. sinensis]
MLSCCTVTVAGEGVATDFLLPMLRVNWKNSSNRQKDYTAEAVKQFPATVAATNFSGQIGIGRLLVFLFLTQWQLYISLFNSSALLHKSRITFGVELLKISGFTYCKSIQVAKSVELPSNATGCVCKGTCIDPRICACARLNGSDFPYVRRDGGRLVEPQAVVFECGPSCGCGPGCVNRTSQRGLRYRLEVFRTPKKGWGVRSWDYIPSGAPVCEYVGILMKTDEIDTSYENNYIFDIDCLQTMEGLDGRERKIIIFIRFSIHPVSNHSFLSSIFFKKMGSSVPHIISMTSLIIDEKRPLYVVRLSQHVMNMWVHRGTDFCLTQSCSVWNCSRHSQVAETSPRHVKVNEYAALSRRLRDVSIPTYLDKSGDHKSATVPEFCIDAGTTGNVARFINHSCQPNLFVQCVLSSHHDIKQARVVLFAADNIPPLKELTYDYGYAVDSVLGLDGKVRQMACYCGAPDCRKRLL